MLYVIVHWWPQVPSALGMVHNINDLLFVNFYLIRQRRYLLHKKFFTVVNILQHGPQSSYVDITELIYSKFKSCFARSSLSRDATTTKVFQLLAYLST